MMNGKSWYRSGGVRKAAAAVLMMVMLCLGGVTCAQAQEQTLEVNLVQSTPEDGYLLVPGVGIAQDIAVEVSASTGDSYVYVRITETNNQPGYLTYELEEGWLPLTTPEGTTVADVYYREHNQQAAASWPVLKDQQIMVNPETMTRTVIEQLYQDSTRSTWPSVAYEAASIALQETDAAISAYEGWRLINGWKWNIESKEISEDEAFETALNVAEGLSLSAYDVKMVDENGSIMQPDGAVEVRLPAAAGAEAAMVLHVLDDHDAIVKAIEAGTALATPKGDGNAVVYESIEASVENGYAVFNATSFSTYYVVSGDGSTLKNWWGDFAGSQVTRYNFDPTIYGLDENESGVRIFEVEPDSSFYVYLQGTRTVNGISSIGPVEGTWQITGDTSDSSIVISTAGDGLGRVITVSADAAEGEEMTFEANDWKVTVRVKSNVIENAYANEDYPVYIGITLNGMSVSIGNEPRVSGYDTNDWAYVVSFDDGVTFSTGANDYQHTIIAPVEGSMGSHYLDEDIKTVKMLDGTDDKSVKGIIDLSLGTSSEGAIDITPYVLNINWDEIKAALLENSSLKSKLKSTDNEDPSGKDYVLRPYVVKLQTNVKPGWHINACFVPTDPKDEWIYFDDNLNEELGQKIEFLNVPARVPWKDGQGTTGTMYMVDPNKGGNDYNRISDSEYVTLTNGQKLRFIGWCTTPTGDGNMYSQGTSFNDGVGDKIGDKEKLEPNGTLYAWWSSPLDRLEIHKDVVVGGANTRNPNDQFTFNVTLTVPSGLTIKDDAKIIYEVFDVADDTLQSSSTISIETNKTEYSFSMQFTSEQYGVVYAPKGMKYEVTETMPSNKYVQMAAENATGVIEGVGEGSVVRFVNGWENTTGRLRVDKKVDLPEGTAEEMANMKFNFTVELNAPEGVALQYAYQLFDNQNKPVGDPIPADSSELTFKLAANEGMVLDGLEEGITYTVSETVPAGWVMQNPVTGTIKKQKTQGVVFVNTIAETNGTLTIIKAFLPEGYTPEAGESFVFTVKDSAEVEIADVVIYGDGSKTLSLPYGTYTVTEDNAWSWRYTATAAPESGEATISSANPTAEITFTNTKSNNNWLDGSAGVTNTFTSQPTVTEHGGEQ